MKRVILTFRELTEPGQPLVTETYDARCVFDPGIPGLKLARWTPLKNDKQAERWGRRVIEQRNRERWRESRARAWWDANLLVFVSASMRPCATTRTNPEV